MENTDKKKNKSSATEESTAEESSSDPRCCYVVDPCGCYCDPCCVPVSFCC